jgi:hypothetical protein
MPRKMLRRLAFLVPSIAILSLLLALEAWYVALFHHVASYGWHAELLQREADIGIPGIKTLYVVRVFNFTFFPQSFQGVRLPGGYIGSGVIYRSQIERWNEQSHAWDVVREDNPSQWKTYPRANTKVWFDRSIYAGGWQAVAAFDVLKKGDTVRMAIFQKFDQPDVTEPQVVVYSPAFKITEERTPVNQPTQQIRTGGP